MNNVSIYTIGKIKNKNLREEIKELLKRLPRVKVIELKEIKGQSINTIKQKEEELILKSIKSQSRTYILTESGTTYTTKNFSKELTQQSEEIQFVISGPYGPSENLKKRISNHLSLSEMTFTHEQALYLLVEQIYRVQCIEKNINYTK